MEEPAPYFCIAIGSWCEITESGKWHGRWCEVLSLAMAGRREGYVVAVPGAATDVWVDQRYLRVIVWPGNPDTAPPRAPHVEEPSLPYNVDRAARRIQRVRRPASR